MLIHDYLHCSCIQTKRANLFCSCNPNSVAQIGAILIVNSAVSQPNSFTFSAKLSPFDQRIQRFAANLI